MDLPSCPRTVAPRPLASPLLWQGISLLIMTDAAWKIMDKTLRLKGTNYPSLFSTP